MDQVRSRPRFYRLRWLILLVPLAASAFLFFNRSEGGQRVDRSAVNVSTVTPGTFYEYVNLSAQVIPGVVRLLDCRVPGTVAKVYAESGDPVRRGDTLLRLVNAELELEVMQRESQLIEQLNAQRQTALLLNQNDFNRKAELVEIDYRLGLETKRMARESVMAAEGLIAPAEFEPTESRYAYYQNRYALLREAYRADSLSRQRQLGQISAAEGRLLANLGAVRALLNELWVIAPADGFLGDFAVRTGQTLAVGDRLGEVYRLDTLRLAARVDEFYLDKIHRGQSGFVPLPTGDTLGVVVERSFPSVEDGRFRLRLRLASDAAIPAGWVRGQSVRVQLRFGAARESLLLADGDFYNDTGGKWVYVLGSATTEGRAERRSVQLGRRNPEAHEVLAGLAAGERVITSAYTNFLTSSTLKLQP